MPSFESTPPTPTPHSCMPCSSTSAIAMQTASLRLLILISTLLAVVLAARIPVQLGKAVPRPSEQSAANSWHTERHGSTKDRDVLVLYFLSPHHPLGPDNLKHFTQEAIAHDTRCNFLLLIPSTHTPHASGQPPLPNHAHYLHYDPSLNKWAAYAWALDHHPSQLPGVFSPQPASDGSHSSSSGASTLLQAYPYFFLIDSSVRGPFIPPMLKGLVPWWQPFLSRLTASSTSSSGSSGNAATKGTDADDQRPLSLVGATISCEDAPAAAPLTVTANEGDEGAAWHRLDEYESPPFVQLRAAAMTASALHLVMAQAALEQGNAGEEDQAGGQGAGAEVADQHFDEQHGQHGLGHWLDPVEMRASGAVLEAGGRLDCLMVRYASVDWRQRYNWACNARLPPDGEFAYDGIQLDPYEVVFVPVDELRLQQQHPAAVVAEKYGAWVHGANRTHAVVGNQFIDETPRFKLPKILEKLTQGPDCFDVEFFLQRNEDIRQIRELEGTSDEELWHYFVYYGQFEPREFRFTCPMNYQQFAGFSLKLHARLLAASEAPA